MIDAEFPPFSLKIVEHSRYLPAEETSSKLLRQSRHTFPAKHSEDSKQHVLNKELLYHYPLNLFDSFCKLINHVLSRNVLFIA